MISQEKWFLCYILLTDQFFSDCRGFPGSYVINFEIKLIFLIESFLYMNKKSSQKI